MPFSFLNGLSAMGQSIATFAGEAGLQAQKSDLAQAQMRLADSLATTRETGLETLRQTGAAALENTRQGGENLRSQNQIAANVALENLREGGANTRNTATIGGENLRSQNQIAASAALEKAREEAEMARTQVTTNAPPADVRITEWLTKATPEQRDAYYKQLQLKQGTPLWMLGTEGSTPAAGAPSAPGAPLDTSDVTVTDLGGPGSGFMTGGTPGGGTAPGGGGVAGGGAGTSGGGTTATGPTDTGTAPKGGAATAPPSVAPPPPSNAPYRNEKALQGVPVGVQATIKAMVEGRSPMPSQVALGKPPTMALVTKANEYDPTFDATTWGTRFATRRDFAVGPEGRAVASANMALGHAAVLADTLADLNNSRFTPYNSFTNWLVEKTGDPRPTTAEGAVSALASEARKVFAGSGGGNLTELQEWQHNFPINGSPAQQKAALRLFVNLLDSRLEALSEQYNRGMSTRNESAALLNPHAKAAYDRLTSNDPFRKPGSDQTSQTTQTTAQPGPSGQPPAGSTQAGTTTAQGQGSATKAVDPIAAAQDAIARGASRDQVIERLRQNHVDPSRLFASPSSGAAPMPGQE
jgi:hypothetical protein